MASSLELAGGSGGIAKTERRSFYIACNLAVTIESDNLRRRLA
jgi:hypothetical protein